MKVTVDTMPALCSGMACNYQYAAGTSVVTGFAYNASTLALTIQGSFYGTLDTVEMGRLGCSNVVVSAAADSITCDLADELPAGSWYPIVTEDLGQVKIDPSVVAETVALSVTSIQPNIDLNPYGGDILTITGTNFPASADARYNLSIVLGGQARCVPSSITRTQIICETEPLNTSRRRMLNTQLIDATVSTVSDT